MSGAYFVGCKYWYVQMYFSVINLKNKTDFVTGGSHNGPNKEPLLKPTLKSGGGEVFVNSGTAPICMAPYFRRKGSIEGY